MRDPARYLGQAVAFALTAALLGLLSVYPPYEHFPADKALIKVSLTHAGQRVGECRRLTREELELLPPNMRKPMECPRGRLPVRIELRLDGALLYEASLPPAGLSGDGPSRAYRRFTVEAGPHRLVARLRDGTRTEGYDFEREAAIVLTRGQNFVIDFQAETGGFIFR